MYHASRVLLTRKPRIFNLISEIRRNDSHVPPAIPTQFLFGLVFAALGGWVNAVMQCAIAWPGRGQVLQPVCWPVRWLVR